MPKEISELQGFESSISQVIQPAEHQIAVIVAQVHAVAFAGSLRIRHGASIPGHDKADSGCSTHP